MTPELTSAYRTLLAGKIQLPGCLGDLRFAYANSKPFPHLVVERMFPEEILDGLLTEISTMRPDQWVDVDRNPRERTVRMRSAAELGLGGERFVSLLHSAAFLYLLSEITGIGQLLPDPYLQGAGFALMRRGDYFDVHADRNVAYDTGLTRRLAMIVFLNKSWRQEYHGELELWSSDGKRREVSVEPLFNRTIVFEVAHPNYHGVPTPLACPPERIRQSFIVYYHTVGINTKSNMPPHTTIFGPRLYGTPRLALRSIAREIIPPIILRAARKVIK